MFVIFFILVLIVFSFLFSSSFLLYHQRFFSSSLQFYLFNANEEFVEFVSLIKGGERMSYDGEIEGERGYKF